MITIQEENFYDMFVDSFELQKENFADGPLPVYGLELNLDVTKYKLLAQKGVLVIVTAREGKNLVGYYSAIVDTPLHFATLRFGFSDAYVIKREYRNQGLGTKMRSYMENLYRTRGAVIAMLGSRKEIPGIHEEGYVHCENRYAKRLEV